MKTKHKIFTLLATVALALMAIPAKAQQRYAYVSLVSSNSATIDAVSGTNVNKVIDVTAQDTVSLQIKQMADASGAHTSRYIFSRSLDRTTWDNMNLIYFDISFNGVTQQTITTNLACGGFGYLRLNTITNLTATINTTNVIVDYAVKRL